MNTTADSPNVLYPHMDVLGAVHSQLEHLRLAGPAAYEVEAPSFRTRLLSHQQFHERYHARLSTTRATIKTDRSSWHCFFCLVAMRGRDMAL